MQTATQFPSLQPNRLSEVNQVGLHPVSMSERLRAWADIYDRDGMRWGLVPSLAAHLALSCLEPFSKGRAAVLDLGCGYGRDLLLFRTIFPHLILDGVEPVTSGFHAGAPLWPAIRPRKIFHQDIFAFLERPPRSRYSVIFANYFIHLFSKDEASHILRGLRQRLAPNGVLALSFVSTDDCHYQNTSIHHNDAVEVLPGVAWQFYTSPNASKMVTDCGYCVSQIIPYSEIELVRGRPDAVGGMFLIARRS